MEREEIVADPRQKLRLEFRYQTFKSTVSSMESYAHKLRKGKRENALTARRARALEEMSAPASTDPEAENRALVEFLKCDESLLDHSTYPVLTLTFCFPRYQKNKSNQPNRSRH